MSLWVDIEVLRVQAWLQVGTAPVEVAAHAPAVVSASCCMPRHAKAARCASCLTRRGWEPSNAELEEATLAVQLLAELAPARHLLAAAPQLTEAAYRLSARSVLRMGSAWAAHGQRMGIAALSGEPVAHTPCRHPTRRMCIPGTAALVTHSCTSHTGPL